MKSLELNRSKMGAFKLRKVLMPITIVLGLLFILPSALQAQEDESFVMNLTEYTVKFGHDSKFVEGVKKWKKCYQENNGEAKWNVWNRVQGKGNVYVISSRLDKWADMAEDDEVGMSCRSIALEFITPHIESMEFNTVRSMPKYSRKADLGDQTLIWVYSFNVKNRKIFTDLVDEISSTIKSKEGDRRGYWYQSLAGGGDDYFVSTPYKDFATLDTDKDNVWEVYEKAHGKSKAEKIREDFNAVLENSSSYMYVLNTELSLQ